MRASDDVSELVVAYQGEPGAYSEEATIAYFGAAIQTEPCADLDLVFQKVASGAVDVGLVPIENSHAGSINRTYDLLLEQELFIRGEFSLPVHHCLMALPGQTLEDLVEVHSHPQALAQCSDFLRSIHVRQVATYDTAGSAQTIREQHLVRVGAVASRRAAQLHGLEILADGIQSSRHNSTRFVEIGREPVKPTHPAKTSLVFATSHKPGALYECLGALARRRLNLTKLESRPRRDVPWQYLFFADFEGGPADASTQEALAELRGQTSYFKFLGSYPLAGR